jgi:hypothetical protein
LREAIERLAHFIADTPGGAIPEGYCHDPS